MFGVGHQHSGALNLSVYLNDQYVCSSYPRYGTTVGKAGDEKGHLVEMTLCLEFDGTSGPYPVGGKETPFVFLLVSELPRQASDCYRKVLEKLTATNDIFLLQGMPVGSYRNTSLQVQKGDRLRVDGWYSIAPEDPRCAKRISFAPLTLLKMIIFPRQAQDKHRESTEQ